MSHLCSSSSLSYSLSPQLGLGVVDELIRVLDHESKPHMLFFNGMNDLICNHVGNEQLLDALPWSKAKEYSQQPRYAWESGVDASGKVKYTPGRPDGYIKQFENISFLKILESGHMVPMDQPAIALVMMKTLIYDTGGSNNGFLSSMQDLSRADPSIDARKCSLDECPNCLPPVVTPTNTVMTSPATVVTLSNLGILLAAFASGIICTFLCLRRQRAYDTKRILTSLEDDMELTDQDSVYRDAPEDRDFT